MIVRTLTSTYSQSGVALISMLLIFAIIAVMTSDIALRLYLDIRRTHYFINDAQARQYALGGEALARQILIADFEHDGETIANDHLNEPWRQSIPAFETEQGTIQLLIEDLDARFNINTLVANNGKIDPLQLQAYQRLLSSLKIPEELANNLADWLDKDSTPIGINTEDQFYLGRDTPYRTANRPITHTSELLAIAGHTAEIVATLTPFITALPALTTININTANSPVLASLHGELNTKQLVSARKPLEEGFVTTQDFLTHESTAGLGISDDAIDVRSHYFQIWVKASYNERIVYLRSLVSRDPTSGKIQLLNRNLEHPVSTQALLNPFIQDSLEPR